VTDVLPTALTFVSSTDPGCTSADGKTVTCQLGDLAPGTVVTIGLVVEATGPFLPEEIGPDDAITNTAGVASPGSNCPGDEECSSSVTTRSGPRSP
jgi:hypothetical protein